MSGEDTKRIRMAFVGCGGHSSNTLQPNAHLAPQVELVAMCDVDEAKASAAAARWGVPAWYADVDAMLDAEAPDAVVVVGPPVMMQPITKHVLGRGVHVFTEKPPAVTSALAKELVDASKAGGAFGMVATHWRHAEPYARARALMADDAFGRPTHCHGWFYAPGPQSVIWDAASPLMSYLQAQGVHLVDCTRSLMGDVAEVSATAQSTDEVFNSCSVSLRFANGATGTLAMAAPAFYWTGHRVFGTTGAAVDVENAQTLRCALPPLWTGEPRTNYRDHSWQTWSFGPHREGYGGLGYLEEFNDFADAILAGRQPVASLEDGYQAMRVLEAINESALTGQTVTL